MPRTKTTSRGAGARKVQNRQSSSKLPGLYTARLIMPEVLKQDPKKSRKPGGIRKPKVEIVKNRYRVTITPATSAAILEGAADELEREQQMRNVCNKAIEDYIQARNKENDVSMALEAMNLGGEKEDMDVDA